MTIEVIDEDRAGFGAEVIRRHPQAPPSSHHAAKKRRTVIGPRGPGHGHDADPAHPAGREPEGPRSPQRE